MRLLYALLISLHPPSFRKRFAPEMLLIFDESAPVWGRTFLFCDGFNSVARQWAAHSGLWVFVIATFIALLQAALLSTMV